MDGWENWREKVQGKRQRVRKGGKKWEEKWEGDGKQVDEL